MVVIYFVYFYTPRKQWLGGGGVYRNHPVCPSVCPSVCLSVHTYLVSATAPKPLDGFWWNLTQRKGTIWRCPWRNIIIVRQLEIEIIRLFGWRGVSFSWAHSQYFSFVFFSMFVLVTLVPWIYGFCNFPWNLGLFIPIWQAISYKHMISKWV